MGWGEPCTCRWWGVLPMIEVGCVAESLERVLASFFGLEGQGKPLRRVKVGHGKLPGAGWGLAHTQSWEWMPPWIWHHKNFPHFHPVNINDKDFDLDRNWEVLEEEPHTGAGFKSTTGRTLGAPPPATSSSPLVKNFLSFGFPGLDSGLL